jgi:hypothetical protein
MKDKYLKGREFRAFVMNLPDLTLTEKRETIKNIDDATIISIWLLCCPVEQKNEYIELLGLQDPRLLELQFMTLVDVAAQHVRPIWTSDQKLDGLTTEMEAITAHFCAIKGTSENIFAEMAEAI